MAPERIESALKKATVVQQVFVHGNSFESCVVAVVVPDEKALRHAAYPLLTSIDPFVLTCVTTRDLCVQQFSKSCPTAGWREGIRMPSRIRRCCSLRRVWWLYACSAQTPVPWQGCFGGSGRLERGQTRGQGGAR